MCFCGSSSSWIWFPPFVSVHPVSCVSVCVSRLSSDVLKGLMSGAQAALPPHLQLAFSGKRWRRLPLAAWVFFCRVCFTDPSLCLCRCQSNAGRRLAEEVLMTSQSSRPLADPVLTDSAHFYAWSAGCPMRRNCFYTHLNIMNNELVWMMRQLYICINVYTDRPNHCGRGGKHARVCVFACTLAGSFLRCRVFEYSWASECVPPSLV